MFAKLRLLGLIALVALTANSLTGCGSPGTAGRSTGGTKIGDREVKFALDGNGGVTSTADTSTVTFVEGKVLVEKTRFLVNDKEVAKIAEDAKLVEINYTGKTLTITADGAKIHEAKVGK